MAFKFEIINNALQITDTSDSSIIAYIPNRDAWYEENELSNDIVQMYAISGHPKDIKKLNLSECIDENDLTFTQSSFRTWISNNTSNSGGSASGSSSVLYNQETLSLSDSSELDTGFLDVQSSIGLLLDISSDTNSGLTLRQTNRNSDTGIETTITAPLPDIQGDIPVQFPARASQIRFQLQNNSGQAITNVKFYIKSTTVQPTITPLAFTPFPQSQAILTQGVSIGQDPSGNYISQQVNEAGAPLVADFGTEVARGLYNGFSIDAVDGRNADIDIGTAPEGVWNGGDDYTGFNCIQAETLSIVSTSVNDSGSLITSGTATGGSTTTLIDSGATFISDGVSLGDMIINDDQDFHGFVSSLTSETELEVFFFKNGVSEIELGFISGDSYRIATANSTGAAVIKIDKGLDSEYNRIKEYVIMNGTTPVLTTKLYLRQDNARVELSGSAHINLGEITARQSTTTANITMVMPADSGQTAICCSTVPKGKTWNVKNLQGSMVRASGNNGSCQIQFQIRERGGSWQTERFRSVSNALDYNERLDGAIVIDEQSDVRWRVQSVSDNDTQVTALFEYFEIDK